LNTVDLEHVFYKRAEHWPLHSRRRTSVSQVWQVEPFRKVFD
jgi:hypothetical protein